MAIIKTNKQIAGIRKSSILAAKTLEFIKPHVIPGVVTQYLDRLMEDFIRGHGAVPAPLGYRINPDQRPYPKSTCISINEVICHGIPDGTVLKEGDIVTIDVTTILNGYYGDTAITLPVGKVSEEAANLIKVTEKCLDIGIRQVKANVKIGEIGYNIYTYAILQGYTVVDMFTGHGVGLRFHEEPQILHKSDRDYGIYMKSGMIFTIEPMICTGSPDAIISEDGWTAKTVDNGLCAQFEHTILVTDCGFEILTLPMR